MNHWITEVEKREVELVEDTRDFLRIKSVLDETTATENAPFGSGIREAYDWLLNKANNDGFQTKDLNGYAGHIEWGEGTEILGVLCHLDVVPEGDGWTSPPYSAEIRDGKIFARGAIDDKGPTMAAYYALKIVKENGHAINKRIRLIIGTDEESQWRCMEHYFKHEEMPTYGFAPDADFPIIYAEKGICDLLFKLESEEKIGCIRSFSAGHRLNMVPDHAIVELDPNMFDIKNLESVFHLFLQENQVTGSIVDTSHSVTLTVVGKSAHGMEPDKGVNAGLILAEFIIQHLPLNDREFTYFSSLSNYFYKDSRGVRLGIDYRDDEKGDITLNLGLLQFSPTEGGEIGVNLRYPQGADFTKIFNVLLEKLKPFKSTIKTHEKPHAVEKDHPLIQTLSKVYEEQTGEKAVPFAIGGGTYARSLDAGVAFGPLFPGEEDVAHQADEYITIDHLKKATAIYAQAISELAK